MSERNAVLAQMLAQSGQPAAPQQDRGLLARLLGGPSSPIDGAPMYPGGPQMSNQMPAEHFAPAPQTFTDYAARTLNPQTPDERMQTNVVRGMTESAATVGVLPMDAASRAARAAKQGYTIDAYKGAPSTVGYPERALTEFKADTPQLGGPSAGFFSDSPEVANRFASIEGHGTMYPVKLKMQNPLVIDAAGRPSGAFQFEALGSQFGTTDDIARIREIMRARKGAHDGVILQNTADEGTVFVPKAPQQVRSRFARFDPANAKSGDILGSAAGLAALGAATTGGNQ